MIYLVHPESECCWIEHELPEHDGLVEEVSKEEWYRACRSFGINPVLHEQSCLKALDNTE